MVWDGFRLSNWSSCNSQQGCRYSTEGNESLNGVQGSERSKAR